MSLAQTAASLLPAVTTAKASGLADDGAERESRALGEPAPTVAPAHEATAGFGGPASAGAQLRSDQAPKGSVFCSQALSGALASYSAEDEDIHFDTTEDLFQVCSVPPDAAEHFVASFACRGFIEGVVQYHDAVSDRRNLKRLICYPKTATVEDGRAAFVAWARPRVGDAALMEELPVVGLVRALAAKYPCP